MLAISGGSGGGLLGTGFSSGHGGLDGAPRGLSALHKRADQLKQWEEREAVLLKAESNEPKPPSGPKIKFSNKTLFLASCAIGDYDECKRLLTSNLVDINDCNIDGLTALHQACIDDNLEMVKFLIEHGADVNCSDNEGWTPLHATASCGHTDIVEVLLENGANPCITNNDGELAIDIAENDTIEDLIKSKMRALGVDDFEFLRKQEQFVMMQDVQEWLKTGIVDDKRHPRSGATILHVAASKGYINIMETILNNRNLRSQIDIDACDNEGWTPLHAACYFQHAGAVEILLRHGASIDKKTSMGQSLRELTDHELILSLIAERKKKLAEEQKLKDQLSNGPPPKTVPPSPPSAPTPPTESETQRKAHAKRARETRRSTQGISADDVNRAKDQLKQVNEPLSEVEKPQEKSALTTNEDQVDNQRPSTPTSSLVSSTDNSCEPSSPESSLPLDQGVHLVRRRRPKRRSTGVNSYDGVKGETNESPDESSKPQTPEPVSPVSSTTITPLAASSTALTSPLIRTEANNSHNRVLNNKSLNDNEENKYPTASTTSTGANTRSRSSSKQSLKEVENAEKDWKKLYEDLQQQYDHLKKEFTKKEQDWSREKRHMQRKISELEEECKQLENYRNDNQRLKDENGALIRVISKLSK